MSVVTGMQTMRSMGVRWMRMEKEFLLCHRDASALILRIVGAWGRWLG